MWYQGLFHHWTKARDDGCAPDQGLAVWIPATYSSRLVVITPEAFALSESALSESALLEPRPQ